MSHQQAIAKVVTAVLSLDEDVVESFCRGNPFDKLLRSYDEFNAQGEALYRRALCAKHYRMSKAAYASQVKASELYGEHRVPLKIIIQRLLTSDRSLASVESILAGNEVVLITKDEQRRLDSSIKNGGLGLKSRIPSCGTDRLTYAGIDIAPETENHSL